MNGLNQEQTAQFLSLIKQANSIQLQHMIKEIKIEASRRSRE